MDCERLLYIQILVAEIQLTLVKKSSALIPHVLPPQHCIHHIVGPGALEPQALNEMRLAAHADSLEKRDRGRVRCCLGGIRECEAAVRESTAIGSSFLWTSACRRSIDRSTHPKRPFAHERPSRSTRSDGAPPASTYR